MNKDILIKFIEIDDLEKFQKDFLSDTWKMAEAWKQLIDDLLPMCISEKTDIKILKILYNIGEEITQICDLMIRENNKI